MHTLWYLVPLAEAGDITYASKNKFTQEMYVTCIYQLFISHEQQPGGPSVSPKQWTHHILPSQSERIAQHKHHYLIQIWFKVTTVKCLLFWSEHLGCKNLSSLQHWVPFLNNACHIHIWLLKLRSRSVIFDTLFICSLPLFSVGQHWFQEGLGVPKILLEIIFANVNGHLVVQFNISS